MIYRARLGAGRPAHLLRRGVGVGADSLHRVMRVRLRGAPRARSWPTLVSSSVYRPDGLSLLYRPDDFEAIRANAYEVSTVDGAPLLRVSVPRGMSPTWSAGSSALLQVRNSATGDEIIAILIARHLATLSSLVVLTGECSSDPRRSLRKPALQSVCA